MNKCQINQRLWSQVKEPNDVMYGWCHRSLIKGSNIWSFLRSLLTSRKEVWYSLERSKFSKNILQNWDRKTVGPFCTGGQQGWRTGGEKGWLRGSKGVAPPSAPPFMTPLFLKKKRSKEVAPLLNPGATPFDPQCATPFDPRYKMVGQHFVNSIWQFWPLCSIPHFISIWNKTFSPISQGIPLKYPWSNTFGERKNIHIWLECYLYWLRCREKYEAEYKNLSG